MPGTPSALVKTLAALVAAGGVWGVIYYYEYLGEETRETAEESSKNVFSIQHDAVEGIDVSRPPAATISLRKESNSWKITAPVSIRADQEKVESMISGLGFLRIEQELKDVPSADRAGFKLDAPNATVTLHGAEAGKDEGLIIGDKAPVGGGYYASKPNSADVLVVTGGLDSIVSAEVNTLRFNKVIGVTSWDLRRFTIEDQGRLLTAARQGEDWRLETPISFPADGAKIQTLWSDVQSVEAESFESEQPTDADLTRFGLRPPALKLTVEGKEGDAALKILFGVTKEPAGVYAQRSDVPSIMKVKQELLDKLRSAVSDIGALRDVRAAPIERYKIGRIELAGWGSAGQPAVLIKDSESAWHRGTDDGPVVSSEDVNALLDAIEELKATELLEGAGAPATPAGSPSLTLAEREGESPRKVTVSLAGDPPKGKQGKLLSSTASPALYLVPGETATKLSERAAAILKAEAKPEQPTTDQPK